MGRIAGSKTAAQENGPRSGSGGLDGSFVGSRRGGEDQRLLATNSQFTSSFMIVSMYFGRALRKSM